MRWIAVVFVFMFAAAWDWRSPAAAVAAPPTAELAAAMEAARAHVAANEEAIVRELRDLLALPNIASNRTTSAVTPKRWF
jgi:hypothetical protein